MCEAKEWLAWLAKAENWWWWWWGVDHSATEQPFQCLPSFDNPSALNVLRHTSHSTSFPSVSASSSISCSHFVHYTQQLAQLFSGITTQECQKCPHVNLSYSTMKLTLPTPVSKQTSVTVPDQELLSVTEVKKVFLSLSWAYNKKNVKHCRRGHSNALWARAHRNVVSTGNKDKVPRTWAGGTFVCLLYPGCLLSFPHSYIKIRAKIILTHWKISFLDVLALRLVFLISPM